MQVKPPLLPETVLRLNPILTPPTLSLMSLISTVDHVTSANNDVSNNNNDSSSSSNIVAVKVTAPLHLTGHLASSPLLLVIVVGCCLLCLVFADYCWLLSVVAGCRLLSQELGRTFWPIMPCI